MPLNACNRHVRHLCQHFSLVPQSDKLALHMCRVAGFSTLLVNETTVGNFCKTNPTALNYVGGLIGAHSSLLLPYIHHMGFGVGNICCQPMGKRYSFEMHVSTVARCKWHNLVPAALPCPECLPDSTRLDARKLMASVLLRLVLLLPSGPDRISPAHAHAHDDRDQAVVSNAGTPQKQFSVFVLALYWAPTGCPAGV